MAGEGVKGQGSARISALERGKNPRSARKHLNEHKSNTTQCNTYLEVGGRGGGKVTRPRAGRWKGKVHARVSALWPRKNPQKCAGNT